MNKDTLSDFAKHTNSKADFFDFVASTFYSQNCALCRTVQGLVMVCGSVLMFVAGYSLLAGAAVAAGWVALFFGWRVIVDAHGRPETIKPKDLLDDDGNALYVPMGSPDIGVSVDDAPIHTVDVETAGTNGDNIVDPK